jgi:hypothetical protein
LGSKAIIQYNHDGTIVKEYDSIKNATIELGIDEHTIIRILKGRNKNPHKLIFKYK